MRKALSKKTRFEVFKRDCFQCQYCGATPPSVVLEVDHIFPVSEGGSNEEENLITSCFNCNRGKSNRDLSTAPQTIAEKSSQMAEKEEQLKEYKTLIKKIKRRKEADVRKIEAVFQNFFDEMCFTESFADSIKKNFLPHFTVDELTDHMKSACFKCDAASSATSYFCGICWNIIKGRGHY